MHAPSPRGRGRPAGWVPAAAAAAATATATVTAPGDAGRGVAPSRARLVPPASAPRPRWHALALPTLALLVVGAGYADLWRGGTSVAAVLLVAGYCALVPLALLRAGATGPVARERPPYRAAALVGALVLALYVATLAPTTAMWDASEYIAVARVLGLPHPPGNPLFVLLAHVAGLLPIPVSYAERINLLAAGTSATAAALWFLFAERVLRQVVPARGARLAAAACAALVGATAFTVWNQSVVNEKVYTVSLGFLALSSWLVLRWLDATHTADAAAHPAAPARADRLLLTIAYLAGLGYAVHPAGFLAGPAVALAVVLRRPATLLRWRLLLGGAGALALGLTLFAVEPIRAAHDPAINEGDPTACVGAPRLDCTLSAETWRRLKANVERAQYGGHDVMARKAPFAAQLAGWWRYFEWQWWRDLDERAPGARRALALAFLALGLLGGWTHWRRERASWWYAAPLMLSLTVLLVFYLNFNYTWGQSPELAETVPREVRERDYFYVWTFSAWGVWVAVGLATVWRALAERLTDRGAQGGDDGPTRRAWALSAPVLLLALVPLLGNARAASRRGETFTREWARDLLLSVAPYAILVTNGDNDSFPLWYAQQVEGVRRDVTLALVPYLGLDWYARQLIRRPVEPYDAARGPELWRDSVPARPAGPPLRMTAAEADAVPPYVELPEPQRFVHGAIDATVPAGVLTRDQILVLRFVRDAFPARPIYFSPGGYAQALGLAPWLRQEGLATRLVGERQAPGGALHALGDGTMLDVPRTRRLWDSVYGGPAAIVREGRWIDRPSAQLPLVYAFTGQQLAQALAARGDAAGAERVMARVAAIARAAGYE